MTMMYGYQQNEKETLSSSPSIETSRFSPTDLAIFMESLDIITRLERSRHERREKCRAARWLVHAQVHQVQYNQTISELDNSTQPSTYGADDESIFYLEAKKIPKTPKKQERDDEISSNYSSRQNSPYPTGRGSDSSAYESSTNSNEDLNRTIANITDLSDSEESGVFAVGEGHETKVTTQEIETMQPMRPRSQVISKRKYHRSARSRIIEFMFKRERIAKANKMHCSLQQFSQQSMAAWVATQHNKGSDHVLDELIQEQFDTMNINGNSMNCNNSMNSINDAAAMLYKRNKKTRRHGFICRSGSAEERFLEKALRYLTL